MSRDHLRRFFLFAAVFLPSVVVQAQSEVPWRVRQLPGWDNRAAEGRCEVRVWVDNRAELRMRGDTMFLRTIGDSRSRDQGTGCTQPIPYGSVRDFQILQTAGRDRVVLSQRPDPMNNFTATFLIENTDRGSDNYAFEATWRAATEPVALPAFFSDPVRACRDAVHQRFRSQNGLGASIKFNGFAERKFNGFAERVAPDRSIDHDSERNRDAHRAEDLIEGRGTVRLWNESREITWSCLVDTRQNQILSATWRYSRDGGRKNDSTEDDRAPR